MASSLSPGLLPILLVPALMTLALVLHVRRRRGVAGEIGDRRLVGRIAGQDLHAVPWRRAVPMLLAAVALGLAAADLRWGTEPAAAQPGSRDVVLVLDASNSMLVEDVQPNRLERQRLLARHLVSALPDDRIGVVAFAGQASVLAPPTRDHAAVEMYIDAVTPAVALQTGTAIGAGIRQATGLLAAGGGGSGRRIIVLVSDGEPLEPETERPAAVDAARRAAGHGIVVHGVGIGTAEGGPVPQVDPRTGARTGYRTDPFTGRTAHSALDEGMLRDIARETRGSYHHLADTQSLDALVARIGTADSHGGGTGTRVPAVRYGWFVGAALLLLALDAAAAGQRRVRT
jgi:Ca-activated chloride channel homolog